MKQIDISVVGIGPGSQPEEEDGVALDYMSMPNGIATYAAPVLPEPEEVVDLGAGLELLERLQRLLSEYRVGQPPGVFDLSGLDRANRELVNQTLGEGEVSILYAGPEIVRLQETRLAGIWRVQIQSDTEGLLRDLLEVADIPGLVRATSFLGARDRAEQGGELPAGVLNAPSILVELNDKVLSYRPGDEAHVVNLTLLPQTEQDLAYLDERLGTGPMSILSRGYGNCRIIATELNRVWWVQYFNSEEKLIVNTLEVVDIPTAALAAQEDIEDSTERLAEILEALR